MLHNLRKCFALVFVGNSGVNAAILLVEFEAPLDRVAKAFKRYCNSQQNRKPLRVDVQVGEARLLQLHRWQEACFC